MKENEKKEESADADRARIIELEEENKELKTTVDTLLKVIKILHEEIIL